MTEQLSSIRTASGHGGYFVEDAAAIQDGAALEEGTPQTDGFERVREPGRAILVDIELSDGTRCRGDCTSVQYAGRAGRPAPLGSAEHGTGVPMELREALTERAAGNLEGNLAVVESYYCDQDSRLHPGIRYGLSQALVSAAGAVRTRTAAEELAALLDESTTTEPRPILAQTGSDRYQTAIRMIHKRVEVIPHGLFATLDSVGTDGDKLVAYLKWLVDTIEQAGAPAYEPRIHIDIYGALTKLFGPPYDQDDVVEYLQSLERAVEPYELQLETPVLEGTQREQLRAFGELQDGIRDTETSITIVADEWCNGLDDVRTFVDAGVVDMIHLKLPDLGTLAEGGRAAQYCIGGDVAAYVGGSSNETDVSARLSAHLALAIEADQIAGKPGMGFDEGFMIVANEMIRTVQYL